ncbi:MAG: iron(III) transport system substrate-binding protein [Verrucomicrobiales bacterium]|jgi:iron(III) transport system substrate-binding protein
MVMAIAMVAAACGSDEATTTEEPAATTAAPATTTAPADDTPTTTAEPPATAAPAAVEEATGLEAVCEVGVEEGSFVYAATIEPDNFARISAPFEARFPGIEIQLQSAREEDYAGQIITALAAGAEPDIDLIYGSQDGLFPLISRDLLDTNYDWTSVDADPATIHETNMIRLFVVGLGVAYNTNLGTPDDLPATWEELIDSKYAGDLVVDPRGNPFDLLSISWGEEATLDYVTRLSATVEPIVIRGGTAGMTEVLAGGALMTTSGRADSNAELQAEDAPIEMHYMDAVPVRILYNGLYKDAKNPNAAACFAGWLATDEGKASFEAVEFKANDFPPAGVPATAELIFVDSAADAETTSTTGQKVQEIIAPDFDAG